MNCEKSLLIRWVYRLNNKCSKDGILFIDAMSETGLVEFCYLTFYRDNFFSLDFFQLMKLTYLPSNHESIFVVMPKLLTFFHYFVPETLFASVGLLSTSNSEIFRTKGDFASRTESQKLSIFSNFKSVAY